MAFRFFSRVLDVCLPALSDVKATVLGVAGLSCEFAILFPSRVASSTLGGSALNHGAPCGCSPSILGSCTHGARGCRRAAGCAHFRGMVLGLFGNVGVCRRLSAGCRVSLVFDNVPNKIIQGQCWPTSAECRRACSVFRSFPHLRGARCDTASRSPGGLSGNACTGKSLCFLWRKHCAFPPQRGGGSPIVKLSFPCTNSPRAWRKGMFAHSRVTCVLLRKQKFLGRVKVT